MKVIPDETTRLAALKGGEVDIIYSIRGELASDLRNTPGLTLKPTVVLGAFHLNFPDQWDPKSPWHDQRVRKAASLAIDRKATNDALTLGYSKITGSMIPYNFEFFWQPPMPEYDPEQAKSCWLKPDIRTDLTPADYYCDIAYANLAEAILDNLLAVGIRTKLRPLERAAFFSGYGEKKFKNIIQYASGAFGNAATRIEAFVAKGGAYVYGSYPDIDDLFQQQATVLDYKKREAILHKIQQLMHERTITAPIWQLAFINPHSPDETGFLSASGPVL